MESRPRYRAGCARAGPAGHRATWPMVDDAVPVGFRVPDDSRGARPGDEIAALTASAWAGARRGYSQRRPTHWWPGAPGRQGSRSRRHPADASAGRPAHRRHWINVHSAPVLARGRSLETPRSAAHAASDRSPPGSRRDRRPCVSRSGVPASVGMAANWARELGPRGLEQRVAALGRPHGLTLMVRPCAPLESRSS